MRSTQTLLLQRLALRMFHEIKVQNAHDQIRHFEFARETGRDGCESALWYCFGEQICRHVESATQKQSHNALSQPSRAGLPRNLKVANNE